LHDDVQFKLGLENITDTLLKIMRPKGKKDITVGLVTNQTGRDQSGKRTGEILAQKGFHIKKVFVPCYEDAKSNKFCEQIPESMLIRLTREKKLAEYDIAGLDLLMFDLQDASMHQARYLALLLETMKTAASFDRTVVVLDRPNTFGWFMEGASLPIPLRHGMTAGELANYFNKYVLSHSAKLCVVPMENYSRQSEWQSLESSKAAAHVESWYGHTLLGLLAEIKPFDLACDTDEAFQCILLPEKLHISKYTWDELGSLLKSEGVASTFYRYFNKKKKQWYSGLHLFILSVNDVFFCKVLLSTVKFFQASGVKLSFSDSFDIQLGSSKIRSFLQGDISQDALSDEINGKVQQFFKKAFDCFIYKPLPKMVKL